MSGSYHHEYHRCDDWDYNDVRPRRRRLQRKRHNDCWDFYPGH
ncbi:hypothetical protein [Cryptosporangium phraense]|nr:hypothetical protein [Cryptosporangium phraense]